MSNKGAEAFAGILAATILLLGLSVVVGLCVRVFLWVAGL